MNLTITPSTEDNIADLTLLLSEYQEFYGATPDKKHNRKFLQNFLQSDEAIFMIAYYNSVAIGYVSLYFSYSSVSATRIAILNDLYVKSNYRKSGFGKELIDYAIKHANNLGIQQIRWCTRINNEQAQKLYKKYDAVKTDWFHYDLYKKD